MEINYLFYFCDGIGSVFDSQVLALLKDINERSIFKKIYLHLGIRYEKQKNYFLGFLDKEGVKTKGSAVLTLKPYLENRELIELTDYLLDVYQILQKENS